MEFNDEEKRKPIKNDNGKRICDYVKKGEKRFLEFKQGRKFDTLDLGSLIEQIGNEKR